MFKKANEELDPVKRCALANKADKLIWAVGHSMIMYQRPNVTATDKKLANMGSFGFTSIDYTKIGFQVINKIRKGRCKAIFMVSSNREYYSA